MFVLLSLAALWAFGLGHFVTPWGPSAFGLAVVAAVVLLGWRATSDLRYVSSEQTPAQHPRPLFGAFCLLDRFLAGQILVAWGIGKLLILAREFIAGLTGISPQRVEGTVPGNASGSAVPMSWMTMALQTVSTATRVQTRVAGHVARELGQQVIEQRRRAGALRAGVSGTVAGPLQPLLTPQEPAQPSPSFSPHSSPWDQDEEDAVVRETESESEALPTSAVAAGVLDEIDAFVRDRAVTG